MARFVDPPRSRENVDRLVELWKERCLLGDGSLLLDDRAVWSLANLQDFRDRFTGPAAIYGTGETFEEKLAKLRARIQHPEEHTATPTIEPMASRGRA